MLKRAETCILSGLAVVESWVGMWICTVKGIASDGVTAPGSFKLSRRLL